MFDIGALKVTPINNHFPGRARVWQSAIFSADKRLFFSITLHIVSSIFFKYFLPYVTMEFDYRRCLRHKIKITVDRKTGKQIAPHVINFPGFDIVVVIDLAPHTLGHVQRLYCVLLLVKKKKNNKYELYTFYRRRYVFARVRLTKTCTFPTSPSSHHALLFPASLSTETLLEIIKSNYP